MSELIQQFLDYIRREQLFLPADRLLLAVSGGLDSTVLVHLCMEAGFDIELMHVNFKLRGEESERDESFVRTLAEGNNIALHITPFNTKEFAAENKLSIQVAARQLRYSWFETVRAKSDNPRTWIVTAHHLNDNIETSFMNWVNGTGIRGLRGMLPRQGKLLRPLLFAERRQLEEYAHARQLSWVEDSSNATDDYTRNFFRHRVMPLLTEMHPAAAQNMAANLFRFRETEILYEEALAKYRRGLLTAKGEEWHIPVEKLRLVKPLRTVYFELLREFGFRPSQLDDLVHLLDSESGKYIDTPSHRIVRHRNWLIVAPQKKQSAGILVIEGTGSYTTAAGNLDIRALKKTPSNLDIAPDICYIPQKLIKFPLILRPWKTGDYFYPLGMRKKKKLARFFIDQKLSKTMKEKVQVLEMDGKIIWVAGLRLDDRFKVSEGDDVFALSWTADVIS